MYLSETQGKYLLAVTADCASAAVPKGRAESCHSSKGRPQLAASSWLSGPGQQWSHCPSWVWVAEAFIAGSLPSLSFVTGTDSAHACVWCSTPP